MDSRLKFRPRLQCVSNPRGTLERNASGFVDWPFKDVGQPRSEYEKAGQPNFESRGVDRQEKLWWGMLQMSVP
jgi:hypothetical protein